jgi:predicted nuclease of predicted toxin-antitoxin system
VSVGLYMDEHVPGPVIDGLRLRGVDVLTAQEDGRGEEDDAALLDRATELGRVLVTSDKDFYVVTARRQSLGVPFSGVVFIPANTLTVGDCINELEMASIAGSPDDFADRLRRLPLS